MRTNNVIFDAFSNGKLLDVLRGSGNYSMSLNPWVSADVPTDWTKVLPLFYEYASKIEISQAKKMLEEAIITLLKSNPEDLYIGMSVLYLQILREEGNRSPFKINRQKLLLIAAYCIKKIENQLQNTKRHMTQNNTKDILAEVNRYRDQLKSKFGIDMRSQEKIIRVIFEHLNNNSLVSEQSAKEDRYRVYAPIKRKKKIRENMGSSTVLVDRFEVATPSRKDEIEFLKKTLRRSKLKAKEYRHGEYAHKRTDQ